MERKLANGHYLRLSNNKVMTLTGAKFEARGSNIG